MANTAATDRRNTSWRAIDIVIAALIGVFGAVLFWAWSALAASLGAAFTAAPAAQGLLIGGWLLPGVLGGLLIRKPGAALFCEAVAASGELVLGSQYGMSVLMSGLIQGLGAEIGFATFRYRRWSLTPAMLAGALMGLFGTFNDCFIAGWYAENTMGFKIAYMACGTLSGLVLAGVLSWVITRALAATGALSGLASRSAHREPAL